MLIESKMAIRAHDKIPVGTRVIIASKDTAPVEFSHPALFEPNAKALAAASARAETLDRETTKAANIANETKIAAHDPNRHRCTIQPLAVDRRLMSTQILSCTN